MSLPEQKRRKLRKGTHSCWECKRRKMKCVFDPSEKTICNSCRRRGSRCISQELPEEISFSVKEQGGHRYGGCEDVLTPVSLSSDVPPDLAFLSFSQHGPAHTSTYRPRTQSKYEKLSLFLHGSLPSRDDLNKICRTNAILNILTSQVMTNSYPFLRAEGLQKAESLLTTPEATSHPVLIARYMLKLALYMHHFPPNIHKELGISEDMRVTVDRLTELSISLVTTKDDLLCSIEGLECVMLESLYQSNTGNLRRSWVAGRRAMGIAQLMGLNRVDGRTQFHVLDPKTRYDTRHMWLRIVILDRQICLLLGLPEGCPDRTMGAGPEFENDIDIGRIERLHCVISSRILERNASKPSAENYARTRALDMELQRAARQLPSKWWLPPVLDASEPPETLFWEIGRLFPQIVHYNLLNLLHLPYMLRSSGSPNRKDEYEYSRITCVNASREVLSRFINQRIFNGGAHVCRTVDFLALMSAMTLILAHLDSKNMERDNLLAHQYLSDRAMIEQTQENMLVMNRINPDALSSKSAGLLGRLLALEASVEGSSQRARRVRVQEAGPETELSDQNDESVVILNIPYFGTIRIASEGVIKETPAATSTNAVHVNNIDDPSNVHPHGSTTSQAQTETADLSFGDGDYTTRYTSLQDYLADILPRHGEYPELTARAEDWAFQGADLAFFDTLMSTIGSGESEGLDWHMEDDHQIT